MWDDDKILDLTSASNQNPVGIKDHNLVSSSQKVLKRPTPIKQIYESKQDSEVKRILEAAKNMPFRFNKNKNVGAQTYRGSNNINQDETLRDSKVTNLN